MNKYLTLFVVLLFFTMKFLLGQEKCIINDSLCLKFSPTGTVELLQNNDEKIFTVDSIYSFSDFQNYLDASDLQEKIKENIFNFKPEISSIIDKIGVNVLSSENQPATENKKNDISGYFTFISEIVKVYNYGEKEYKHSWLKKVAKGKKKDKINEIGEINIDSIVIRINDGICNYFVVYAKEKELQKKGENEDKRVIFYSKYPFSLKNLESFTRYHNEPLIHLYDTNNTDFILLGEVLSYNFIPQLVGNDMKPMDIVVVVKNDNGSVKDTNKLKGIAKSSLNSYFNIKTYTDLTNSFLSQSAPVLTTEANLHYLLNPLSFKQSYVTPFAFIEPYFYVASFKEDEGFLNVSNDTMSFFNSISLQQFSKITTGVTLNLLSRDARVLSSVLNINFFSNVLYTGVVDTLTTITFDSTGNKILTKKPDKNYIWSGRTGFNTVFSIKPLTNLEINLGANFYLFYILTPQNKYDLLHMPWEEQYVNSVLYSVLNRKLQVNASWYMELALGDKYKNGRTFFRTYYYSARKEPVRYMSIQLGYSLSISNLMKKSDEKLKQIKTN